MVPAQFSHSTKHAIPVLSPEIHNLAWQVKGVEDHRPAARGSRGMGAMTERRIARRYDLSLPVIIRVPTERVADSQKGKTRDVSTRGVYFVLDQDMEPGSELDITLTLPAEITHGSDVFVRALGKVVRVERRMEDGSTRMGVAAVIERYDIIRGENAHS